MNVELLERIAVWLEDGAPHVVELHNMSFNMSVTIKADPSEVLANDNWCGTACCIAGAAVTLERPQAVINGARNFNPDSPYGLHIWDDAVQVLGLTNYQAQHLFSPFDVWYVEDEEDSGEYPTSTYLPEARDITPAMAAKTIRHLMATGVVVWTREE